ncbi:hypothetical protein NM688_g3843 [Phlebia brevispora]|uniref:Uncharacterized protein n=1 Tax=Phlebia brevispora TaxID=194682 RepID=A0ACC1T4L0_9APHY|nr:hypothetical protein NM688_g3843 [Phlebia brevispora]
MLVEDTSEPRLSSQDLMKRARSDAGLHKLKELIVPRRSIEELRTIFKPIDGDWFSQRGPTSMGGPVLPVTRVKQEAAEVGPPSASTSRTTVRVKEEHTATRVKSESLGVIEILDSDEEEDARVKAVTEELAAQSRADPIVIDDSDDEGTSQLPHLLHQIPHHQQEHQGFDVSETKDLRIIAWYMNSEPGLPFLVKNVPSTFSIARMPAVCLFLNLDPGDNNHSTVQSFDPKHPQRGWCNRDITRHYVRPGNTLVLRLPDVTVWKWQFEKECRHIALHSGWPEDECRVQDEYEPEPPPHQDALETAEWASYTMSSAMRAHRKASWGKDGNVAHDGGRGNRGMGRQRKWRRARRVLWDDGEIDRECAVPGMGRDLPRQDARCPEDSQDIIPGCYDGLRRTARERRSLGEWPWTMEGCKRSGRSAQKSLWDMSHGESQMDCACFLPGLGIAKRMLTSYRGEGGAVFSGAETLFARSYLCTGDHITISYRAVFSFKADIVPREASVRALLFAGDHKFMPTPSSDDHHIGCSSNNEHSERLSECPLSSPDCVLSVG